MDYSRLTGLEPISTHPIRYLWTDAFAICNYLELYLRTEEEVYLDLTTRLIDQVHHVLGRHREDDLRNGWISGLDDDEGRNHPTAGGLRIGKRLNERRVGEPASDQLEWEQDGQYFHYLTKWMHSLNRASRIASDPKYTAWAVELAKKAHSAFCYVPAGGGRKRMYWKMSIDLTRPLVMSMGQHDPLDGFVTYHELQVTAGMANGPRVLDLSLEIEEMGRMVRMEGLPTNDPLGMGGLLTDASRIAQIEAMGTNLGNGLLEAVLDAALISVSSFAMSGDLDLEAESRLAFRELGLSIGLKSLPLIKSSLRTANRKSAENLLQTVTDLERFESIGAEIDRFWTSPKNQNATTWSEHRAINMVMLATSLAPQSFLSI